MRVLSSSPDVVVIEIPQNEVAKLNEQLCDVIVHDAEYDDCFECLEQIVQLSELLTENEQ